MHIDRTDLAMEAREAFEGGAPKGVTVRTSNEHGFSFTHVRIENEAGAQALGKSIGTYVTIEHAALAQADEQLQTRCAQLVSQQLRAMLPARLQEGSVLVIGLGNRRITPDSLGPCAAGNVFVTRHMIETLGIHRIDGIELQSVCSLSPGVLGVTGLETELVVRSLCATLHPRCVICIDSLASMKTSRLLCTVQLADSGIAPGSGVGNHAHALNEQTLGIPVIAIGVPTVVYASVIIRDAFEEEHIAIKDEEDMLVTPRNIDEATDILSNIIAQAINMALQPQLDPAVMKN